MDGAEDLHPLLVRGVSLLAMPHLESFRGPKCRDAFNVHPLGGDRSLFRQVRKVRDIEIDQTYWAGLKH